MIFPADHELCTSCLLNYCLFPILTIRLQHLHHTGWWQHGRTWTCAHAWSINNSCMQCHDHICLSILTYVTTRKTNAHHIWKHGSGYGGTVTVVFTLVHFSLFGLIFTEAFIWPLLPKLHELTSRYSWKSLRGLILTDQHLSAKLHPRDFITWHSYSRWDMSILENLTAKH